MRGSIGDWIKGALRPTPSNAMLAALSFAVVLPAYLIVQTLEPALILPAFSVLLFSGAAIAVVLAWSFRAERRSLDLTLWDIAGGLTMTGCAAAILGEPDQVALFFEHLFEYETNREITDGEGDVAPKPPAR